MVPKPGIREKAVRGTELKKIFKIISLKHFKKNQGFTDRMIF